MVTTEAAEVTLEAGNAQATIRPYFGGRITSFRFDGREHLADGLILATDPYRGGCHPLAPWAGTLPDAGILREENATFDVPPRPNGQRKHGYVDGLPWEITRVERARVELRCDVVNAGLWNGQAHQSIELEHDRLRVTLGYTAGAGAPIALGLHPWFLREPDGSIPRMTFAAKRRIVRDRFGREAESVEPAQAPRDEIYVADGFAPRLEWTDGRSLTLLSDAKLMVVYEQDPLGVCVEPWTHTPGEFISGRATSDSAELTMELVLATEDPG